MDARELRIGNLFVDKQTQTIINVIGLTENIITFSGHFKNDWKAEPIPLTEEWLLKFGFCKFKNYNDFSKGGIIIHGRKRGFVLRKSVPDIKYVHQLQNLYFALTGEELEIKL
jgi:hypothetical protein